MNALWYSTRKLWRNCILIDQYLHKRFVKYILQGPAALMNFKFVVTAQFKVPSLRDKDKVLSNYAKGILACEKKN